MKTFVALFRTTTGSLHCIEIKAENFSEAEKKVLIFPLLDEILQITIIS